MAEAEDTVSELAEANSVRVLETNVLHASDVIYWLDGASAENEADMQRIPYPLQVRFTQKPRDVNVLHGSGRTALWRNPEQPMIAGRATEAERTRPAMPDFTVAGEVHDPFGRFNRVKPSGSIHSTRIIYRYKLPVGHHVIIFQKGAILCSDPARY